VQSLQTPLVPHAKLAVPAEHAPVEPPVATEQQPPLHVCVALQAAVHACTLRSQAWPVGQSVGPLQPHVPFGSHAPPCGAFAQLWQTPPGGPQAVLDVPAAQVPVALPTAIAQHPPLHGWAALHVVEQTWAVVSHAFPLGQSVLELHPQASVGRHTWPVVLAVQSTHAVPLAPHAVSDVPLAQLPLLQQPATHGEAGEHATEQR
jgi:hypothetical protein